MSRNRSHHQSRSTGNTGDGYTSQPPQQNGSGTQNSQIRRNINQKSEKNIRNYSDSIKTNSNADDSNFNCNYDYKQDSKRNNNILNNSKPTNSNNRSTKSNNDPTSDCSFCGKAGHLADRCRCNLMIPDYRGQRQNSTSDGAMEGVQHIGAAPRSSYQSSFCRFCNRNLETQEVHLESACPNLARLSKLFCSRCSAPGHLRDECRQPCAKCGRSEHSSGYCSANAKMTLYARLHQRLTQQRPPTNFRWQGNFAPVTRSQKLEAEMKAEFSQHPGEYPNQTVNQQRLAEIQAAIKEPLFPNPNITTPIKSTRCAHVHSHTGVCSGVENVMQTLQKAGVSGEEILKFERFVRAPNEDVRSEGYNATLEKMQQVRGYGIKHMNWLILNLENKIREMQLLSKERMDELKLAIRKNHQFFKDPRAITALFRRIAPYCLKCGEDGAVVDRYFHPIHFGTSFEKLMKLEDWDDWGVHVAFKCTCSAVYHKNDNEPACNYDWRELLKAELMEL